jgi:CRISPR-associated endonuclease/helicase Cas3
MMIYFFTKLNFLIFRYIMLVNNWHFILHALLIRPPVNYPKSGQERIMLLIAHTSEDGREQSFEEHARNVAELAASFASEFGAGSQAYLAGLLHDVGKCAPAVQAHLHGDPAKVEHSAAAAELFSMISDPAAMLLSYCVAGHHTGLPDGGISSDTEASPTLTGKLKRQSRRTGDYLAYRDVLGEVNPHIDLPTLDYPLSHMGFSHTFWTRMVFSCLVDADYLDTEAFMKNRPSRIRTCEEMRSLLDRLNKRLAQFPSPSNDLGYIRKSVLDDCIRAAKRPRGIFTLTVPTGGGKTLSSLAFALNHAVENDLRRVIYVIPYTSIIEQTAREYKEALGMYNVLEHHSLAEYDAAGEEQNILRLAAENWDLPVVVTTNVQFFESLFANKTSRCRKLHNIANSVIIFDEAQMFPGDLLLPCIRAIEELERNYRCTAVLCSATQPALDGLYDPSIPITEICGDSKGIYKALRRVHFEQLGELDNAALAERLNNLLQVLCIVNTRAQAQALFNKLLGDGNFHLSTLMTPRHRREKLAEIRERLKEGQPCRVISTSLIEAGVDVDFPCVFREEAGLDSVIQAAGRCNREGNLHPDKAVVYVFRPEGCYVRHRPAALRMPIETALSIEKNFTDIASPDAIYSYFTALYRFRGEALDHKRIVPALDRCAKNGLIIPFAEVARQFQVIDSPARTVLVGMDEKAELLIAKLRDGQRSRELMREAGQYAVTVYEKQFNALHDSGALILLDEELAILRDMTLYSDQTGLNIPEVKGLGIIY